MYIDIYAKSFPILTTFEFSRQIFRKILKCEILLKKLSSGIRVIPCGQTDRHGEGNSRFSKFLRRRAKITELYWTVCVKQEVKIVGFAIEPSFVSYISLTSSASYRVIHSATDLYFYCVGALY